MKRGGESKREQRGRISSRDGRATSKKTDFAQGLKEGWAGNHQKKKKKTGEKRRGGQKTSW